jgi:hypothetical protein
VILASMRLFSHIKDWKKLYRLAKEKDCWQQVGALYDVARMYFKVRRMPAVYAHSHGVKRKALIPPYPTKEPLFYPIERRWRVSIPFRKADLWKVNTS